ncbi:hypothetical protein V6N13_144173 [Hibiscus sabdariffa]
MVFLLSLPTSRSRSCSGVNGIHVESHTKLASLAGTQDYAVPPPLVDHSKSITYVVWLSHTPLRYVEPYFGGVAMTAYGSQALPDFRFSSYPPDHRGHVGNIHCGGKWNLHRLSGLSL